MSIHSEQNLLRPFVVLISANQEWQAVLKYYHPVEIESGPYGQFFRVNVENQLVVFVQGGWGKISAAASAQWAVACWSPPLLINLGTCGGFANHVQKGEVILATETLVYDVIERMGDPAQALQHYSARPNLPQLPDVLPQAVRRARLISADQDIDPDMVEELASRFGAVAADWESGAIAWVAEKNKVPCLILRGVSDVVSAQGGEAYVGSMDVFTNGATSVMNNLLSALPKWLVCVKNEIK